MRYLFLLAMLSLAGCAAPAVDSPTLTATAAPTTTPAIVRPSVVQPGAAPTIARPTVAAPTPVAATAVPASIAYPAPTATPVFPEPQIGEANLAALRPLRTIGVGRALQAALAPDARALAVATSAGVALFELPGMRQLRFDPIDGGVTALAWSPDGALLAAEVGPVDQAGTVLLRAADGVRQAELAGAAPAFSPDGQIITTVEAGESRQPIVRLWRAGDATKLAELAGTAPLWSPNGQFLATVDTIYTDPPQALTLRDSSGARLFDAPGGSTAFSPDSRLLALAAGDEVRLHALPTGRLVRTLSIAGEMPRSLAFSADGRLHVVLSDTLQTWSVVDGRMVGQVSYAGLSVSPLRWGNTGGILAVSNVPDSVPTPGQHLIRMGDGRPLFDDDVSASVTFSRDDRLAALVSYTGAVKLLDLAGGASADLDLPGFTSIAFSPDAQTLATASQNVLLWSVTDGVLRQSLGAPALAGDRDRLGMARQSARYSPDGRILTVGGDYYAFEATIGSATAWDVAPGAAGAKLWDIETGSEGIGNFDLHAGAFSPTAQAAAFTNDGNTVEIHTGDGVTRTLDLPGVTALEWSPDGSLLALGDKQGAVRLVALPGMSVAELGQIGGEARGINFSPDGTLLAARNAAGGSLVWRIGEPSPIARLATAADDRTLIFTADNRMAIAGGRSGVAFYRLSDGQRLRTLPVTAEDLAIGPRRRLLAVLHDGQVQLWGIPA